MQRTCLFWPFSSIASVANLSGPPLRNGFPAHPSDHTPQPQRGAWVADSGSSHRTLSVSPIFGESGAWNGILAFQAPLSTNISATGVLCHWGTWSDQGGGKS